ncbi:hypothetical protein [Pedobacter mucosus]|uniref:hypothetical protein n=1 Tax=Pedobacter mucosus TaxID=2895286 RepID=UPI001EE44E2A|nr:hypothetical protein [Pedobacter mucosus]UKT62988.1 hypothetical protein LOK61_14575 [Pedobacter mucosus]
MQIFFYAFHQPNLPINTYRIMQFNASETYDVYEINNRFIGKISRDNGKWEQNTGGKIPQKLVDSIGLHIDSNKLWI